MNIYFLDELQKPWVIKSSGDKSSRVDSADKNPDAEVVSNPVAQDEILIDVEKVDNILKQARQLRLTQEQNANPTQSSKSNARSKRGVKPSSAPAKSNNRRPVATSASAVKGSLYPAKENQTLKKESSSKTSEASSSQLQDVFSKQAVVEKTQLNIADVVRNCSLPSKYVKLRALHNKLARKASRFDGAEKPCGFKKKFISHFNGEAEADSESEQIAFEKRVLTPYTSKVTIPHAISLCQRLIALLKHKFSHDQNVTPVSLYYQKLAYSRATQLMNEIENMLCLFQNMRVRKVDLPAFQSYNYVDDTEINELSTSLLTYENTSEIRKHLSLVSELKWNKLDLVLKEEIHDVFMDFLRLQQRTLELEKKCLSTDTIAALTAACGLLAKDHRCSSNPAIVLYD